LRFRNRPFPAAGVYYVKPYCEDRLIGERTLPAPGEGGATARLPFPSSHLLARDPTGKRRFTGGRGWVRICEETNYPAFAAGLKTPPLLPPSSNTVKTTRRQTWS